MNIFLGILLLLSALFLIAAVLLQNGKSKGTGVVTGGAETFFGKNKGKSIDKKLSILTAIVAVVFVSQDYVDIFGGDTDKTQTSTGTDSGDLVVDTATGSDSLSPDVEDSSNSSK